MGGPREEQGTKQSLNKIADGAKTKNQSACPIVLRQVPGSRQHWRGVWGAGWRCKLEQNGGCTLKNEGRAHALHALPVARLGALSQQLQRIVQRGVQMWSAMHPGTSSLAVQLTGPALAAAVAGGVLQEARREHRRGNEGLHVEAPTLLAGWQAGTGMALKLVGA